MSRSHRWAFAFAGAAALAFAAPLSAQQVPAADAGAAPFTASMQTMVVSLAPIPALESTIASETLASRSLTPLPIEMARSQSVALMVVGGAGLIVGSLIDGDTGTIIMVGGAAVGLFGLFQYLR